MVWLAPLLGVVVQLFSLWLQMKGNATELDKKWLTWLKKKEKDSIKSIQLKDKIDAALKWIDDHPIDQKQK